MVDILLNGSSYRLQQSCTISQLLEDLKLDSLVAVELNQLVVSRSAHDTTWISCGDRIEIIHAVAGG